jgi:hypothetical protein
LLVVLAAIAVVVSCRDPTEIQLEARTNVVWHAGIDTSFTVGSPGQTEASFSTTETRDAWGADGFVGSLVVVPGSSKNAPLSVKVVMGITRDPHDCSIAQPDGCIFARRTLSYVPHRSLDLPIELYAQCAGVACDASTTCNFLGKCVSSAIDPSTCDSETGCAPPGDKPPADGGIPPAPLDSGEDAPTDAPHDAPKDAIGPPNLDGGSDAGAAGDIACGASLTCHMGTYCCFDPGSGNASCPTSAQPCPSQLYILKCDGPEDCLSGQCCANGQSASCAPMGAACAGGNELCHGPVECGGQVCAAASFAMFYGICGGSGGM